MFLEGQPYEAFMGRWSRRLAPMLVQFAGVQDGEVVLDVGCGTGSLAEALVAADRTGTVLGVDPSPGFVEHARSAVPQARFEVGDAQKLQFHDATFARTLALLVINFVPDTDAAAREMIRVTQSGGTVAAVVWDYQEGMQMLNIFWQEVLALFPEVDHRDERHMRLCREGALAQLWHAHGLADVQEQALAIEQDFESFDDYWLPFLGGVGPAGAFVAELDEHRREQVRERLRERLSPGGGPFTLTARAWAARARVP